jgi:hypothetical protein
MALAVRHIKSYPTVTVTHLEDFVAQLEATPCLFRNLSFQIVTRTRKEMRRNLAGEFLWRYVSLPDFLQT